MFLEIKDIHKSFGENENRVEVLKGIDINVNQGEFVVMLGPSGSGKSTLLHLLGGVDKPSSGEVIIKGESIYKLREKELSILRRRKLGFVFQFFNLIPVLTAEENIEMPVLLDNGKIDKNYMNELLKLLGLEERRNHQRIEGFVGIAFQKRQCDDQLHSLKRGTCRFGRGDRKLKRSSLSGENAREPMHPAL